LAHSYGSYILTASTAIQLAEETDRQKGNGVFTKALIDCLHEGLKESITIDDLYNYAFKRLRDSANQTPKKLAEQEGLPIEIGNFRQKLARLAEQERAQLISTARDKLNALVPIGVLPKEEVEWWVDLLERDEKTLSLRNRQLRDDLVCFLKGDLKAWIVFGNRVIPEPLPQPEIVPPITPPESRPREMVGAAERPKLRIESPAGFIHRIEVSTKHAGDALSEVTKRILATSPAGWQFISAILAIGGLIVGFIISSNANGFSATFYWWYFSAISYLQSYKDKTAVTFICYYFIYMFIWILRFLYFFGYDKNGEIPLTVLSRQLHILG
jgi:hypothetical protein